MANQIRTSIILFFASLAIFLVGNNTHALWDRDEPRYAVATREMLRTGDWVVPHFNGQIRYDKPILTYWLMASPMALFGENEFGARFASAVMGALRVAFLYLFAVAMGCSRRGALLAAAIAGLSSLLLLISKASTTDSTLVLTVLVAMWMLWLQRTRGFLWGRHLVFWGALALSGLVKGPPGLAIVGFGALLFEIWSWWKGPREELAHASIAHHLLRLLTGMVVFAAIGLPWVVMAWIRTDGDFFMQSVGRHVIERAKTDLEGHGGPLFYYFPVVIGVLIPFTGVWLNSAVWSWRRRHEAAIRFLWSWFVPGFVMFSLVSTKLPHYVAPLIPALALMAGLWWTEREQNPDNAVVSPIWWKIGGGILMIAGLGALLGIPIAAMFIGIPVSTAVIAIMAAMIATPLLIGGNWWMNRDAGAALRMWIIGWLVVVVVGLTWGIRYVDEVRPSKPAGLWIQENAPPGTRLLMVDYDEPTLIFYGGGQFEKLGNTQRNTGFKMLNDLQTPTAMVTTARRWADYRGEYEKPVESRVTVRFEKKAFHFEQGEHLTIIVVGNW